MYFYFNKYEDRMPGKALEHNNTREKIWQVLAVMALVFGAYYIGWRWLFSLNYNALWFAIPLVIAETGAYVGLILFVFNMWRNEDPKTKNPPLKISQCTHKSKFAEDRNISVDIFFTTYNEDTELVRLSIRDAKKVQYPHPINIKIHVLDDGDRDEMKKVAEEEKVNYITRVGNIGFKAGNLRNAMEITNGDFIVICDADTRPFPSILKNTLGYFRDPDVAWVQTPQWFYDIPSGINLKYILGKYFSKPGFAIGKTIEKIFGEIKIGKDPLDNDPQIFYDIIQRRRNRANASFCCGAGSIHRREAVMEAALKCFSNDITRQTENIVDDIKDEKIKTDFSDELKKQFLLDSELTPYKFHVSEDLYTSIQLHSDTEKNWKSIYHPNVESKMLSPQDLLSWTIQRFKYAGGSLDIFFNDNPLLNKGLSFKQKMMYGTTFYSYFGCIWNTIFLFSPIIYLFTNIPPVNAYSKDFFLHLIPFFIFTEAAFQAGTWGASVWAGRASYISFFYLNLKAIWTVIKGEQIKFPVTPKDIQSGNYLKLVVPQISIVTLTLAGFIFAGVQLDVHSFTAIGGYLANVFWGFINILALSRIIKAAFFNLEKSEKEKEILKLKFAPGNIASHKVI